MSIHLTDDALFTSWEATPEPEVGTPSKTTILEEVNGAYYLWDRKALKERVMRYSGPTMKVEP